MHQMPEAMTNLCRNSTGRKKPWNVSITSTFPCLAILLGIVSSVDALAAEDPVAPRQKSETFDTDPGWEGKNNRVVPTQKLIVKQDFGYSNTNFAGRAAGELGGTVQRSTTPASYATKVTPKTLDDRLSASGTFAITSCQG